MKEEDLALARALVSDSKSPTTNISSGAMADSLAPQPLRKTLVTQFQDKTRTFR